jgi:hypothetical protein
MSALLPDRSREGPDLAPAAEFDVSEPALSRMAGDAGQVVSQQIPQGGLSVGGG